MLTGTSVLTTTTTTTLIDNATSNLAADGQVLRPENGLIQRTAGLKARKLTNEKQSATQRQTNNQQQPDLRDASKTTTTPTSNSADSINIEPFEAAIVWRNIILFVILHSFLPIALYLLVTEFPVRTFIFSVFLMYASGIGVTAGCHRLWSHKAYKARLPVQLLLAALQTMAGQNSIYTWSRDHRVHHKFSETNADPHNIKRGFFFAHMGWLLCKKHPDVKEKGQVIDMSDLEANKVVMFQHRHFWWLAVLFTVTVPTMIPVLFWGEKVYTAFVFAFGFRYLITLHGTWLVNSAAHYHGTRPYDKQIEARESPVLLATHIGEGFHNYHHTFPFDYAASEFGQYMNVTTRFIDTCAALGLVYDRRKVDTNIIRQRRERTGDLAAGSK